MQDEQAVAFEQVAQSDEQLTQVLFVLKNWLRKHAHTPPVLVNVAKQLVAAPVVAAHVVIFAEQFLQVFYAATY
jgi:uncharacterized protein YejL (UPF0352 family)